MKQNQKQFIIFVVVVLLSASAIYISINEYQKLKLEIQSEAFTVGYQQAILDLQQELFNRALTCEPINFNLNNQTVALKDVRCP